MCVEKFQLQIRAQKWLLGRSLVMFLWINVHEMTIIKDAYIQSSLTICRWLTPGPCMDIKIHFDRILIADILHSQAQPTTGFVVLQYLRWKKPSYKQTLCSSNPSFSRVSYIYVYMYEYIYIYICCCCYVAKSCPALCNSVNCSILGFPVLHYLPEFAQVRVCWVTDAIQPSHPLPSPSRPVLNLSQHQGLFQWVGSLHQVAHVHCSSICGMYIYFCSFEDLKLKTSKTVLLTSYLCDYMKMK